MSDHVKGNLLFAYFDSFLGPAMLCPSKVEWYLLDPGMYQQGKFYLCKKGVNSKIKHDYL